ncbi:MAG TPA: HEAT repeat domain-containing protein, partial [Candidatus Acidoferrum sp.]|nr:HEAT repeat domain-containing protein [Candidatus Acidoferrum sp.]
HNQSIYVFALKRGITDEEFLKVNRLLAGEGRSLPAGSSLGAVVSQLAGGRAEIQLIDWSASEFTDETEIDLAAQARAGGSQETSWESFIRQLLHQGADDASAWMDGGSPPNVGDERLAGLTSQTEQTPDGSGADRRRVGGDVQEGSSAGSDASWGRVCRVASCVAPGLRTEQLRNLRPPTGFSLQGTVNILEDRDAQLVLEVLERIGGAGRQIHPKALRLLELLAGGDPAGPGWRIQQLDRPSQQREFSEHIQTLLSVSGFPSPPPAEQPLELPSKAEDESSPAAEKADAAAGARDIPRHYASTLLDLLQAATEVDTAETGARAMAGLIFTSGLAGNWEAVTVAWGGLDELAAQPAPANPAIGDLCHKVKTQFEDGEKLSRLAAALLAYGVDKAEQLGDILRLAGQSQAQHLVETLALEERKPAQRALLSLVVDLKEYTLPHVIRLLDDSRGSVVHRMLQALQQMGDQSALRKIEKLLVHGDLEVRLEALRTLVLLGSPRAPALLLRAVQDSNEKLSVGAIAIASQVARPEVIQALLVIAKDPRWLKQSYDLPRKTQAVRSLVAMGQREIFPELYRLAAKRPLFHAKAFRKLRVEMFKSLAQADVPEPGTFLRLGRNLRDAQIANCCREIERRQRAGAKAPSQAGSRGAPK